MLIFYTNSQTFRSLAVDFCMKKELRTNYLVRQPLLLSKGFIVELYHFLCSNEMIWTSNKRNPKIIGATLRNVNEYWKTE